METRFWGLIAAACMAVGCGDDSTASDDGESDTEGEDTTGDPPGMTMTGTNPPDGSSGGDDDDDDDTGTAGDDDDDDTTGDDDDDDTGTTGDDDDDDTGTTGGDATLVEIVIEPVEPLLVLELDEAGELPLTVSGTFDDDSVADVTDLVEAWEVTNADLGDVVDATFQTDGFDAPAAQATIVTAQLAGLEASTQITVVAVAVPDALVVTPYDDEDVHDSEVSMQTDASALDLFLNVDTTGSMGGPIAAVQTGLDGAVDTIAGRFADVGVGVGNFEDFPIGNFGSNPCFSTNEPDQPFALLTAITTDELTIDGALADLTTPSGAPVGCGADGAESLIEALYQVATGEGLMGPNPTFVEVGPKGIGGVGFREDSVPVVTTITDALSHPISAECIADSYPSEPIMVGAYHEHLEAYDALNSICSKSTTLVTSGAGPAPCSAYSDATALALATSSRVWPEAWDFAPGGRPAGCGDDECCTGLNLAGRAADGDGRCELVYIASFDGAGTEEATADGALMAATFAPLPEVTLSFDGSDVDAQGEPLPGGVTTNQLVIGFEAMSNEPGPLASAPDPVGDLNWFYGVVPGTQLNWSMEVDNDLIPDIEQPTLVSVDINNTDGCRTLDTVTVWIVVPPTPL